MSTPPGERVRDVLTARHRKENALLSRTGFALVICIFVSLTSALPTFGHDIPKVCKALDANPNGDPATICGPGENQWHQLNEEWDEFVRTHPNEEYRYANTHWHMDIDEEGIGGWDKCVAEAYDEDSDDYNLVEGNCPDGTSTEVITPPPPQNDAPRFTSATKSIPENSTSVPDKVEAVDGDSQDSVTGYDIVDGADQGQFLPISSTGDLTFKTAPDHENPQDANGDNVYEVVVEATSGAGGREKTAEQTITVRVTDVDEPPDTPDAPSVLTDSETSLEVRWEAPTNDGRPAIKDYDYRYEKTSDPPEDWTEVTSTMIAGSPVVIPNLDEDTAYYVQIRAEND